MYIIGIPFTACATHLRDLQVKYDEFSSYSMLAESNLKTKVCLRIYDFCIELPTISPNLIKNSIQIQTFFVFFVSFPKIRYCMKFLNGQKSLPSPAEMLRDTEIDMEERRASGLSKRKWHSMGTQRQVI